MNERAQSRPGEGAAGRGPVRRGGGVELRARGERLAVVEHELAAQQRAFAREVEGGPAIRLQWRDEVGGEGTERRREDGEVDAGGGEPDWFGGVGEHGRRIDADTERHALAFARELVVQHEFAAEAGDELAGEGLQRRDGDGRREVEGDCAAQVVAGESSDCDLRGEGRGNVDAWAPERGHRCPKEHVWKDIFAGGQGLGRVEPERPTVARVRPIDEGQAHRGAGDRGAAQRQWFAGRRIAEGLCARWGQAGRDAEAQPVRVVSGGQQPVVEVDGAVA
ncbi:hypothetical protein [Nannocystis pusilla]|uniref:hypothetical protein n=1 Tax=Nannocystis pusilla TaxID=889268 RepID=UPI003B81B72F